MKKEDNFLKYLKRLIKEKELSFTQIERVSGISTSYLSQILSGKRKIPPEETLRKLARALGVNEFEMLAMAGKLPDDFKDQIENFLTADQAKDLGAKIRQTRIDKGYSVKELALAMCYPEEVLIEIEEGKTLPKEKTLITLAQALGKPLEFFLPIQENKEKKFLETIDMRLTNIEKLLQSTSTGKEKLIPIYPFKEGGENPLEQSPIEYWQLNSPSLNKIELGLQIQELSLEAVANPGDIILGKQDREVKEEGKLYLYLSRPQEIYQINFLFKGPQDILVAGLTKKDAIFNYYQGEVNEIIPLVCFYLLIKLI